MSSYLPPSSKWLIVVAFLVAAVPAAPARATETFTSPTHGYSVTVPDGWVRVPNEIVTQVMKLLLKPNQSHPMQVEAIYQKGPPGPDGAWMQSPYESLIVIPYPSQPSEAEMRTVIAQMAGVNPDAAIRDVANPNSPVKISGAKFAPPQFDPATASFHYVLTANASGDSMKSSAYGHFGHDNLIITGGYAATSRFAATEGDFQKIADSFKFDPAAAYQKPALGGNVPVVVGTVVGVLVAGILVAAVLFAARGKRPPIQPLPVHPLPPGQYPTPQYPPAQYPPPPPQIPLE